MSNNKERHILMTSYMNDFENTSDSESITCKIIIMIGAVDKIDMILNSVNSIKKCLKWYKQYFFHLMDLAIYNTYILYKNVFRRNLSFASFHLKLIKEISNR